MYRIETSIDPGCLNITKFFLWDTLTIEWNVPKLYVSNDLVQLPKSVTVPLKHKNQDQKFDKGG